MEAIREIFKDKKFSDEALMYLENAINEFEQVLGEYVPREKLIEMVKNNIDSIEFVDKINYRKSQCTYGIFHIKEKKIEVLGGLSEEEKKSVFFHEFLHAIVTENEKLYTGFQRVYYGQEFQGMGWNEGFVQMMTVERDKKITGKRVHDYAYPVLTELVGRISGVLGKEDLIEMYFNNPGQFLEFFDRRISSELFINCSDLIFDFDVIHKSEHGIIERKVERAIFGYNINGYGQDFTIAADEIVELYMNLLLKNRIDSTKELDDMLNSLCEIYDIMGKDISIATIEKVINNTKPEIINQIDKLSEENSDIINSYLQWIEIEKEDTQTKLKMLKPSEGSLFSSDEDRLASQHEGLKMEFYQKMLTGIQNKPDDALSKDPEANVSMIRNLSDYIIGSNLSIENLKIVRNRYVDYASLHVYEIYNYQEDGSYQKIDTLFLDLDKEDLEFKQPGVVSEERKKELCTKYPLIATIVGETESGDCIFYDNEGRQGLISKEYEDIEDPFLTDTMESGNGLMVKSLNKRIENLLKSREVLKSNNAPPFLIAKEQEMLENAEAEREAVLASIRKASGKGITINSIRSAVDEHRDMEMPEKREEL